MESKNELYLELNSLYKTGMEFYEKKDYKAAIVPLMKCIELDKQINNTRLAYPWVFKYYGIASAELGLLGSTNWAFKEGLKYLPDVEYGNWVRWYQGRISPADRNRKSYPKLTIPLMNRGPRPQFNQFPEYPESERRKEREGIVDLKVMIDEIGSVLAIQVLKNSTESKILEESVIKAAMNTIYLPALKNSIPIQSWTSSTYTFGNRD
jgi:TonB family protein